MKYVVLKLLILFWEVTTKFFVFNLANSFKVKHVFECLSCAILNLYKIVKQNSKFYELCYHISF